MDNRRDWVIRCLWEQKQHRSCCWATLTYSEKYVPPTLHKPHLSSFLKRLRKRLSDADEPQIRFFGCGEYGEKNKRPHYHVILFGTSDRETITACWNLGRVQVDTLTPAAIAYVAGYANKKRDQRWRRGQFPEQVDPETGEVFTYVPPFLHMSRNPGIAAGARDKFASSWQDFAIHNGKPVPVPRYLHEGWKKTQSPEAIDNHSAEKRRKAQERMDDETKRSGNMFFERDRLRARAEILIAKHNQQAEKRKL